MNIIKTGVLLLMLTMILVWVGGAIGGSQGATIAFIIAIVMNFGSYWFCDKIVLSMYRAQELSEEQAPELFSIVRDLAANASIPMPRVFLIPVDTPNAFATGRNPQHACVAVTRGILSMLTDEEIKGVLAHEISHVKNRDILIMSVTAAVAGAITLIASMARWAAIFGGFGNRSGRDSGNVFTLLAVAIVAPIAAMIVQLAISRTREYGADARGAKIAGSPHGLASALEKLQQVNSRHPIGGASPTTAHLFIVNPLSADGMSRLFSTHPPMEERIRRLRSL